jgi:aspartyl protease family protein
MKVLKYISFFLCISLSHVSFSSDNKVDEENNELKVVGLFKNAALIYFNGEEKLYRNGDTITKDIKLVKATTSLATFLIEGKKVELGIDSYATYSATEEKPKQKKNSDDSQNASNTPKQAKIFLNRNGQYLTIGFINGWRVNFLVDTGANIISMGQDTADKLGINYREGRKGYAIIADGSQVTSWRVILNKVQVGEIELNNIEASVLQGSSKDYLLLGMSFLGKLKMENEGKVLTLTKQY